MKLSSLLQDVEVCDWNVSPDTDICGVSSDSRSVCVGGLFVCIDGERHNGHDFVSDALKNGAVAIVALNGVELSNGVPYVKVKNTRLAEAHIWNRWYGCPADSMKTVAVTGTNGKTSTVFILREIFKTAGCNVGIISTVRVMAGDSVINTGGGSSVTDSASAMTTPDPEYLYGAIYRMKEAGVDTLIFEASSHALAQYKIDPINVDVAVFTNLSEEHLDYHGNMENYFAAKARLVSLSQSIVINVDDSYMSRLSDACVPGNVITCSTDPEAPWYMSTDVGALRQRSLGMSGIEYIFFSKDAVFKLVSQIPGRFTISNTMLASAAAIEAGVSARHVKDGIAALRGIDGRLEAIDIDNTNVPFEIFIDYAHTPAALENLLETVRDVRGRGQRITVLFGCGGDRDRSKRRKMGQIASRLADFVIVTSDNCRGENAGKIISEILPGIDLEKPHAVIRDRREAIEYAVREAQAGDIILLIGKGHEKYEIDSDGKKPFDEAEVVREAVKKYY